MRTVSVTPVVHGVPHRTSFNWSIFCGASRHSAVWTTGDESVTCKACIRIMKTKGILKKEKKRVQV